MADKDLPPPFTRVAAYALCLDEQSRMLMVRIAPGYTAVGQWTLPGGSLDFGEHPEMAAIRELREETGYLGEIGRVAFVASWTRGPLPQQGWGAFQAIQIVYRVGIVGGDIRHETDESSDMAAWFAIDEVRTLPIVPLVEQALEHIAAAATQSTGQAPSSNR